MRKSSTRFLLIFSLCTLAAAGVVWACVFEDDDNYSVFSPEAFVAKQYTPFFYDRQNWYYGNNVEVSDNNNRFNGQVISEWDNYLNHQLNTPVLRYLLLNADKKGIDSVHDYIRGKINILKPDSLYINIQQLDKNKIGNLFSYLALAKDCEKFAVGEDRGWYDDPKPSPVISPLLEKSLSAAFNSSKDDFVKQRLWFQLVRYYFFNDDTTKDKKQPISSEAKILVVFDKYKATFPQNLTYYRALGYVAGYYRRRGEYARANYLYSRCYDFSFEMKIPSKFSFRAEEENEWLETLKLAKNNEEKITLWHMLGMEYDPLRAIKEIAKLNPKSDKIDLLLSRLINSRENDDNSIYFIPRLHEDENGDAPGKANHEIVKNEIRLVDSIALKNVTAKPYYWNIAAGYLHYMHKDYKSAGNFYDRAKPQLPTDDKLITAQYKLLAILLKVVTLKHIDASTEASLVEPLNWLKDVERDGSIQKLRFAPVLQICSDAIVKIYKRQGETLKANCFNDTMISYANKEQVQRIVTLMTKANKSAFEKTILRYYPHTLDQLYYHQAITCAYNEEVDNAILLLKKINKSPLDTLPANPFDGRIKDCHDCDQAARQKQKFTPLTFLKTVQKIKTALVQGNDKYKNALLLGNAYYNISFYGNNRPFYGADVFAGVDITSQTASKKYYLLALRYALTNEQRAKCTFMASKCEHNEWYSQVEAPEDSTIVAPPNQKYFGDLKKYYADTKYYREVLRECGYFKTFVSKH